MPLFSFLQIGKVEALASPSSYENRLKSVKGRKSACTRHLQNQQSPGRTAQFYSRILSAATNPEET